MIIWFAILIPIICSFFAFIIWRKQLVIGEVLFPTVVCLVFIAVFKFTVEKIQTTDTEYQGAIITTVDYYEPWETYVRKTCSRTYKCGKSTCTSYYDCSYCDYNQAKFIAYDDDGRSFSVSKDLYVKLIGQWNTKQEFHELNRSINHSLSCGKDGDMYRITWNNEIKTVEASVLAKSYENRVQAAQSAFNYEVIEDEQARKIGLYIYPKIYQFYRQTGIMGLDDSYNNKDEVCRYYEYINGDMGPTKKVKLFVLVYKNKPLDIASKQESYWCGGNDNEFVVCIGTDSNKRLQWVKPFSWTKNRRAIVEAREEIMSDSIFDPLKVANILHKNVIPNHFKRRDFKEFSYLTVEPPLWAIITTYVITALITGVSLYWGINNDYEND
jgi:hypothetical protein